MMSRLVRLTRLSFTWKVALPRFYTTMKARSIKLATGDDSSFNTLYLPAHNNSVHRPFSSILTVFLYPFPVILLCIMSCCLEGACSSALFCYSFHSSVSINIIKMINKLHCPSGAVRLADWTWIHGSQYMRITRQALDGSGACLRQWMSGPLMPRQSIRPTVLLSTSQYNASKHFFLSSLKMCLLMFTQVILSAKRLVANFTLVRSHTGVYTFMSR